MILDRRSLRSAIADGRIVVTPFDPDALRVNSYDVHLSPILRIYYPSGPSMGPLDAAHDNPSRSFLIPPEGAILDPGKLYLGATIEYTEAHGLVPWLDGRSSIGRLGLSVHVTAGRGDAGFCGCWTLELTVVERLRVYAGMAVAQLTWMEVKDPGHGFSEGGDYASLAGSRYQGQGAEPVASRMHQSFPLPDAWVERADILRAEWKARQ